MVLIFEEFKTDFNSQIKHNTFKHTLNHQKFDN